MCLILFAWRRHPRYELVLAANRDEFYGRPTAPLHVWEDLPEVLAGRDLKEGGTWLGLSRRGRFAAITNYRDPRRVRLDAPSRGILVSGFLTAAAPALDYAQELQPRAAGYNGFNLLLHDGRDLVWYSNRGGPPRALEPGVYGLSNHLLDTPWPKVRRGRDGLAALLAAGRAEDTAALLDLLADRTLPPDNELPDTGVDQTWERLLAPLFIISPSYGTVSSSVLRLESGGGAYLAEKTWADGALREWRLGGAGEGNRTPTPFRETDFESVASTSSATPARGKNEYPGFRRIGQAFPRGSS